MVRHGELGEHGTPSDASLGPRVVARIDHVYARVANPRALFDILTTRLGLPRSYGFTRLSLLEGGAVSLGNIVFLEALRYAPGRRLSPPPGHGLDGLALESALPLPTAATDVSRRGIAHSPPLTYRGDPQRFSFGESIKKGGLRTTAGPIWSQVLLGGLLGEKRLARLHRLLPSRGDSHAAVALGALSGAVMSSERLGPLAMAATVGRHPTVWLHEFHVADMRAATSAAIKQLHACGGGKLGICGVSEVVLGAKDPAREHERWQRLLAPSCAREGAPWRLGDGPSLRLVEDDRDGIKALVCEVRSLEQVVDFLERDEMPHAVSNDEARIAPAELHGVDLRLVPSAQQAAASEQSKGGAAP